MSVEILGMPLDRFSQAMMNRGLGEGEKGYFYKSKSGGELVLKSGLVKEVETKESGEVALSLKELVSLIKKAEEKIVSDPETASSISQSLSVMADAKTRKEKAYNVLIRVIRLICDCVRNFFSGLGFKSTATIAAEEAELLKQLGRGSKKDEGEEGKEGKDSDRLQTVGERLSVEVHSKDRDGTEDLAGLNADRFSPLEEGGRTPLKPTDDDEVALEEPRLFEERLPIPEERPALASRETARAIVETVAEEIKPPRPKGSSDSRGRALERYASDQASVNSMTRRIIFADLRVLQRFPGSSLDDTNSVEGLIKWITGKKIVDITDPKAALVVQDCLRECNQIVQKELVEWLIEKELFTPELLKNCTRIILEKMEAGIGCEITLIEAILKYYLDYEIYAGENREGIKDFPSNDGFIVSLMLKLIELSLTVERVEPLLVRFMALEDYTFNTFKIWLNYYFQKERGSVTGSSLYRIRDRLILNYSEKAEWKEELKKTPALERYVQGNLDLLTSV